MPSIVPLVAGSVIWLWILNPQTGLVNTLLAHLGVPQPGWLASTTWAKPALILMSLWSTGTMMVVLLAALQNVPASLYEAGAVDGAGTWRRFVHITLPQISPSLLFAAIVDTIGGFQYFGQQYIMTGSTGAPANATLMYATYLFDKAFVYNQMGYAAAMAWILFVILLICIVAILALSRRFVYYAAD
jgi:multiple sugar transport system permease protein